MQTPTCNPSQTCRTHTHQAMWWSDMMKPFETCFRCTVWSCTHVSFLCALCFSASPRGDSDPTLISARRVRWRVATRKRVPTCKIDVRRWGTREERRDARMNKTKSASDWGVPSRILRLHLLQRMVCVWVCECARKSISPCICVRFVRVCVCVCCLYI